MPEDLARKAEREATMRACAMIAEMQARGGTFEGYTCAPSHVDQNSTPTFSSAICSGKASDPPHSSLHCTALQVTVRQLQRQQRALEYEGDSVARLFKASHPPTLGRAHAAVSIDCGRITRYSE